jgi:hypothetical protein
MLSEEQQDILLRESDSRAKDRERPFEIQCHMNESAIAIEASVGRLQATFQVAVSELGEKFKGQLNELKTALTHGNQKAACKIKDLSDEHKAKRQKTDALMQKQLGSTMTFVKINVGGHMFETSKSTLCRIPDTFFTALLSGAYKTDTLEDGSFFIDRDGEHFGYILEYMRDTSLDFPKRLECCSLATLYALKTEFDFFGIDLSCCARQRKVTRIHVVGGLDKERQPLAAEIQSCLLDSKMNRSDRDLREITTRLPDSRTRFGVSMSKGRIVCSGGAYNYKQAHGLSSRVDSYCPTTLTWEAMVPLPDDRCNHKQVTVDSDIYILGGSGEGHHLQDFGKETRFLSSVLKWHGLTSSWLSVKPLPRALKAFAACVYDGKIYVFGGSTLKTSCSFSTYVYTPATNMWQQHENMLSGRCLHTATVRNGLIYITGGRETSDDRIPTVTCAVDVYNPRSQNWSSVGPLKHPRAGHSCFLHNNLLVVMGGSSRHPSSSEMGHSWSRLFESASMW